MAFFFFTLRFVMPSHEGEHGKIFLTSGLQMHKQTESVKGGVGMERTETLPGLLSYAPCGQGDPASQLWTRGRINPVGMQWRCCCRAPRLAPGKSRKPFSHSEQQPVREWFFV